jgi:hypothetical protein
VQPTVQGHPLLGNRPVDTLHSNEYATIGEAVFSVVHAVLIATQCALSAAVMETVFSASSVPKAYKRHGKIAWSSCVQKNQKNGNATEYENWVSWK